MCDKPIALELWDHKDVLHHWDAIVLRSHATIGGERVLYQEGMLSGMPPPDELISRGFDPDGMPDGTALFGTFAA